MECYNEWQIGMEGFSTLSEAVKGRLELLAENAVDKRETFERSKRMTDRDLRKLNRAALIQLLIEQMEENEELQETIEELEDKLEDRTIAMANAGSIADAALALNHVFDSADQAAAQYLENVQQAYQRCGAVLEAANKKAALIVQNAQMQAQEIISQAEQYASAPAVEPEPEPQAERQEQQEEPVRKEGRRRAEKRAPAPDDGLGDLFNDAFAQMKKKNRLR